MNTLNPPVRYSETERLILHTARNLFLKKGYAATRTQEIADAAGINKALLHYYFRTKEKLFRTIFQEVVNSIQKEIFTILNSDLELFEKIRFFFREYIDFLEKNSSLPGFVIHEIQSNPGLIVNLFSEAGIHPPKKFIEQIQKEAKMHKIRPTDPFDLITSMLSLSIFPVIAAPLLQGVFKMPEKSFKKMLKKRKKELPEMIIKSLKI